jgi:alpha-1,6-mannosyltransferase
MLIPLLSLPAYIVLFFVHRWHSMPWLAMERTPPDLGYGAQTLPVLQYVQIASIAYLFAIYAITLWRWRRWNMTPSRVAWCAVACTAMAWTLMPANSWDVLDYLGFGRLVALYQVSPYTHTYSEFTDDFASYVTWDLPMPYGPVVLPVFVAVARLCANRPVMAVYALKLIWAAIHLLNAWLVYVLAGGSSTTRAYAAFLFALNPLILLEQLGNAHNDGLLLLCGLLALVALQRGRDALAVVLAFAATFVKTPGVFWLAGVVVLLARRRRWRSLAWGGSITVAALGCMWTVFPGPEAIPFLLYPQWPFSEDSLHTLLIGALHAWRPGWNYDDLFAIDRVAALVPFLGVCIWRFAGIRDFASLIREVGLTMLLLLLGFSVSVYPWYLAWLIPVAALTDSPRLRYTILVFCVTALSLYAFPFALVEHGPLHRLFAALRLGVAFGLPIVFWSLHSHEGALGERPVAIEVTPVEQVCYAQLPARD